MGQTIAIALGGSAGAVLRYWMSVWLSRSLGSYLPWATLSINVLGSALMGLLFVLINEKLDLSDEWRLIVLVGFLGSFTTFSTFSLETVNLLQHGRYVAAISYIGLSVLLCVVACLLTIGATSRYF